MRLPWELQGTLAAAALSITQEPAPTTTEPLLQLRRGHAESPAWLMVQAAEFEPEPLSVERLRVRAVWSAEGLLQALLNLMASEKWFHRRGSDYYLTEAGHAIKEHIVNRWPPILSPLQEKLLTDLDRLEVLLARVIAASLECSTPPGSWSLAHSRHRAPAPSSPAIVRIFHYCADLNAFRDDAHNAAWQPYRVHAFVWEAFSYLRNGLAETADQLFEQLAYRGYAREDYQAGLRDLAQRGWIDASEAGYALTEQGCSIHKTVEQLTDQYFYNPWSVLSLEEQHVSRRLLQKLNDELSQMLNVHPA
jgi:hypothetical protein